LSIVPWLSKYSKETVLVLTTILASYVTSKDAITEEQANKILGEETPLEAVTRKVIGKSLVTSGLTIKRTPFVYRDFGDQVGGQMVLIGQLLNDLPIKKETDR